MSPGIFAVALTLAAQEPEEVRAVESWTCSVKEQLDRNVSGMLQLMVYPDGRREGLSYYVSWADQPGYIAEQQMNWTWIPLDADKLWKPDEIGLSVDSERTDKGGLATFRSPKYGRISRSARDLVKSLRPTFNTTWVRADEAYLVAQLWAGWSWTVELTDRKGVAIGSQAILLPGPEAAQAMFTRLRTRLKANAGDPAAKCTANLEPSQWEREQETI